MFVKSVNEELGYMYFGWMVYWKTLYTFAYCYLQLARSELPVRIVILCLVKKSI